MFEMKAASFAVNDRTLLQPTSLRFEQGRVYGLIGHNGSGNSTLLKLLARQQPLSDGEIRFDDKPLPAWGARDFARQVAYLPQHLPSAENLLGRELVEMGRYPWRGLLGRMGAEDHRQVERAIALTHTERFADRLVDTLSGGERGRVALTKLMLRKDNLLLLDEPTNHLDMDSREVLEDALQDFPGTILAISHDRYFINRFADRVMVMNSDGVTEYLGNFDDYVEKRDRPQPPAPAAEGEVTRTAATRERKRDRQQAARARELRAQVKRAEEAIEENERLLRELEAKLADPATYADAEAARELGERYRAEQARSEALYEALEAAEAEAEAAE